MIIIFIKLFVCYVMNTGTKHYKLQEFVQVVLCSAASVTTFTFVAFHSGSGEGNRS